MTEGQLREAAKAAARAAKKAQRAYEAKQPKPVKPTFTFSGKVGAPGPHFQAFIDLAKKHGWASGYQAPESQALLFDTFALLKQVSWSTLRREMADYTDFGYLGGVADFVGGAYMRSQNEEGFQMAFQANKAGLPIVISRV